MTIMGNQENLIILIPVYNDWESFAILVPQIDQSLAKLGLNGQILAVDDGSEMAFPSSIFDEDEFRHILGIDILHLVNNMGHQRAIAIGLSYIYEHYSLYSVVVMDTDGEDRPEDICLLISAHERTPSKIIFAKRMQRSEKFWFRMFYYGYRLLFSVLTGKNISFGNFSLVPPERLHKIVNMPEIWNHYAGAILKSRLPISEVPTKRGSRYKGSTSMNFAGLVLHGMSAISVYLEIVTVRLLVGGVGVILAGMIGLIIVFYIRFFTDLAIPGWATNLSIGIAVIIFQAILLLALLNFVVLNLRSNKQLVPAKEYNDFCDHLEKIL